MLSFLVPQVVTASRVILGAVALVAAVAGREDLSATLITLGVITDMVDGPVAARLGVRSDFGAAFDYFADYLCYVVAPAVLSRSMLGGGILWTVLVALPLSTAAVRYSRNLSRLRTETFAIVGIPGLGTVVYGFLVVGFVFARPASFLGAHLTVLVLAATITFASAMMVAPIRYPKLIVHKAVFAPVAIGLALMPFVFTRPLALCMLVLGTLYTFGGPLMPQRQAAVASAYPAQDPAGDRAGR